LKQVFARNKGGIYRVAQKKITLRFNPRYLANYQGYGNDKATKSKSIQFPFYWRIPSWPCEQ